MTSVLFAGQRNSSKVKRGALWFSIPLVALVVFVCHSFPSQSLLDKKISLIPKEDKLDLEIFFRHLICDDHIGYTLFGDKPISISGYYVHEPIEHVLWGRIPHISIDRLWKVWEKHRNRIKMKNYLWLNEPHSQDIPNLRIITVINKRAFLKVIHDNIDEFQRILGHDMTPDEFLDKVRSGNTSLFDLLHRNEVLYGILLGYGKKNAQFFDRRYLLMQHINRFHSLIPSTYEKYSLRYPKNIVNKSLEKEYDSLESRMEFFDLELKLSCFSSPHFIAIKNDEETAMLKIKYMDTHRQLIKSYSKGDFLKITFQRLEENL